MSIVDSHCHLYLPEFAQDIDEVIHRAGQVGVEKFFLPNIDSTTIDDMLKLVAKYPDKCFPLMGLHPTSVKSNFKKELEIVENELKKGKYLAVGEIGIDLYWDKTFLTQQIEAFEYQIELAKELCLPIIIHARDSFEEIFKVIDRTNDDGLTGIFHCFTGSLQEANRIIEYGGFKMGIGGVVTFKNGGLDKFLEEVPLKYLVVETDSPYLAPAPYRGKRNESSYLTNVIQKLADIYNRETEEIADITTANSLEIFNMS